MLALRDAESREVTQCTRQGRSVPQLPASSEGLFVKRPRFCHSTGLTQHKSQITELSCDAFAIIQFAIYTEALMMEQKGASEIALLVRKDGGVPRSPRAYTGGLRRASHVQDRLQTLAAFGKMLA